eukprot:362877-Chlamydomonas_euryale.AAC.8
MAMTVVYPGGRGCHHAAKRDSAWALLHAESLVSPLLQPMLAKSHVHASVAILKTFAMALPSVCTAGSAGSRVLAGPHSRGVGSRADGCRAIS